MPELRRSTRASTVEATKRLEEPPVKKAKTSAAEKKSATKTETESEVNKLPKPAENESHKQKSAELEVGDEIPDLTLLDENENEVSLKEVAQKSKFLVIFAYPKASTPGCTKQAAGFQRNYSDLQALDTAVYGLSADSPKSQMSFVTKQGVDGKLTIKKIQISPDVSVDSALKDVQRLEQESGDANGVKEEEGKDSKQNGGKKD